MISRSSLKYENDKYYLTSGVTSRGANPVPPVVKIKLSSFSSHQSIRVSWKKTVVLSHRRTCMTAQNTSVLTHFTGSEETGSFQQLIPFSSSKQWTVSILVTKLSSLEYLSYYLYKMNMQIPNPWIKSNI